MPTDGVNDRYREFLVAASGTAPRTLLDSIRGVANASVGFSRSWIAKDANDALTTSDEAFEMLDHIQNELLRHRDTKTAQSAWETSKLKAELDTIVGQILDPATPADKSTFFALAPGNGAMPAGSPLTLAQALNKLKHRDTGAVNFIVSPTYKHTLFIYTLGGMGRQDSLSRFDVQQFCAACKRAAQAIDA